MFSLISTTLTWVLKALVWTGVQIVHIISKLGSLLPRSLRYFISGLVLLGLIIILMNCQTSPRTSGRFWDTFCPAPKPTSSSTRYSRELRDY